MGYDNKPMEAGKSTGNLYANGYKEPGDKKPEYTGWLDITREQIQDLIELGKKGEQVKVQLSCWEYPSKKNPDELRYWMIGDTKKFEGKSKKPDNDWSDAEDSVPF